MSFNNNSAGQLIYAINALIEIDPDFTTSDAVKAGEAGFIEVLLEKAHKHRMDVSFLERLFSDDPESKAAVDDLYSRWTNASETGSYLLSDSVNGWLWLSSISIDSFLVGPYGSDIATMK